MPPVFFRSNAQGLVVAKFLHKGIYLIQHERLPFIAMIHGDHVKDRKSVV